MHSSRFKQIIIVILLVSPFAQRSCLAEEVDFAHDVAPILREHCVTCHTNGTYKAGFSMDTRSKLLDSGTIELRNAEESDFIRRLLSNDPEERMPAEAEPLGPEKIKTLTTWINQGLTWQAGFTFKETTFRRPLALRRPTLPAIVDGRSNPIDRFVDAYWQVYGIERPAAASDTAFLRRIFLDTIGLLPSHADLVGFASDHGSDRRRRLATQLLSDNRRYAEHWLTFWNDLLRNDYAGTGYIDGGRKPITGWLYKSLMQNKRYDVFVRELISPTPDSEGFIKGIKWRGRVNASQIPELQFAQNVSQVFLGLNMKCASCHDSFINELRLTDAYGMAAIVSDSPLEIHRCDKPTGKTAVATFLYPELGHVDAEAPKQQRLAKTAELMTSPSNGRFARTIVNRIWERLMGRGLVHPVDIMGNEAWSEELLEYLGTHLVDNGYDVKRTIELIVTSEAYAVASSAHDVYADGVDFTFLGPAPKRMTAEQFMDNVWRITGTAPGKSVADLGDRGGEPVRASIVQSDELMRILGRPNREQVVTTRPAQLTTLQALNLTNGQTLATILDQGAENLLAENRDATTDRLVTSVFQRALQRDPSPEEFGECARFIEESNVKEGVSDLLWTVFMLPEFQIVR